MTKIQKNNKSYGVVSNRGIDNLSRNTLQEHIEGIIDEEGIPSLKKTEIRPNVENTYIIDEIAFVENFDGAIKGEFQPQYEHLFEKCNKVIFFNRSWKIYSSFTSN